MYFRVFASGLCLVAAVAFLSVNSWLLGHFGYRMGASSIDAWGYAIVSGVTPWVVAILPFLVAVTWKGWRPSLATLAGGMVWLAFVVFNLIGASGHIGLNRSDMVADREHAAFEAGLLRGEIGRLEKALITAPDALRAVESIDVDIRFLEASPTFKASDECARPRYRSHRRFCAQHADLLKERAETLRIANARAELAKLKAEMHDSGPAATVADPQAAVLSAVTGYEEQTVRAYLPLMLPLILELGSMTLFAFAMQLAGLSHKDLIAAPRRGKGGHPEPTRYLTSRNDETALLGQPEPIALRSVEDPIRQRKVLEEFFSERVRPVQGASVSEQSFFEHYCQLARERGVEPMLQETFRRSADRYVPVKSVMNGETYYHDVVVVEPPAAKLRVVA